MRPVRKHWLSWVALAAMAFPLHADDPELPQPAAETVPVEESKLTPDAEPGERTEPDARPVDEPAKENPDVTAIRSAIDSYLAAFNTGDAAKLAGHFTENAEVVTPAGATWKGRGEIEKNFAAFFKSNAGASLGLPETTVRLLSSAVGMEAGIAHVTVGEESPSTTEYEAVHVKTSDYWNVYLDSREGRGLRG